MKRISTLLIVLLLTNIPISCIDECGNSVPEQLKITKLSSSVGTFSTSVFSNSKSTNFSQAAIQIKITDMEVVSEVIRNYSFINTAYACSPPVPEIIHTLETITISSESLVHSQENDFLPGESLNELFKITEQSYSDPESSIAEFIERKKYDTWSSSIIFQLKEKPDGVINQSFTIVFGFSDSEKISIQTPTFEVSN